MQDASTRPAAAQLENHKLIAQSRISPRPNLANDVARAKAFLCAKAAASTEAFGLTGQSTLQCIPPLPPLLQRFLFLLAHVDSRAYHHCGTKSVD